MDCDATALWYRWLEYLVFGRRLQRHRVHFLEAARNPQHALLLGDGDGRFLEHLVAAYPRLHIDVIEKSGRMLSLAKRRLRTGKSGLNLLQGDARQLPFPKSRYDLFATHFFLDCFSTAEVEELAGKVALHASPGARWMVSEFRLPKTFWLGMHANIWLAAMYFFFRIATGLRISTLPDHRSVLEAKGFTLLAEHTSMGQFVASELWQLEGRQTE
jgi:ubiquinone/menaquinone biosynthesis C-methylase UbiE